MSKNKVVVIDDKIINELIYSSKFLEMFPSVSEAVKAGRLKIEASVKAGTCKPCQIKSKQPRVDSMSAKVAISQLSPSDKENLKKFLDTEQVKVVFKAANEKIVQINF